MPLFIYIYVCIYSYIFMYMYLCIFRYLYIYIYITSKLLMAALWRWIGSLRIFRLYVYSFMIFSPGPQAATPPPPGPSAAAQPPSTPCPGPTTDGPGPHGDVVPRGCGRPLPPRAARQAGPGTTAAAERRRDERQRDRERERCALHRDSSKKQQGEFFSMRR